MKQRSARRKSVVTSESIKSEQNTMPQDQRPQPVLAFVDADIVSGRDELARENLFNNLRRYRTPGVSPLWVHWQRQRADLRFVCTVHDFAEFNDFMLDVVRGVADVRETTTILSFGGHIDIDTFLDLEMEVSPSSQTVVGSVMIDVQPGVDRQCFQALLNLPPHPEVRRVWLLNCYHSNDADLMMMMLAKSEAALTGYVMSWIRTTPGVIDTELITVMDWRWMASPDDIVELCELFFTDERAAKRGD
jgi:hypothetical protein